MSKYSLLILASICFCIGTGASIPLQASRDYELLQEVADVNIGEYACFDDQRHVIPATYVACESVLNYLATRPNQDQKWVIYSWDTPRIWKVSGRPCAITVGSFVQDSAYFYSYADLVKASVGILDHCQGKKLGGRLIVMKQWYFEVEGTVDLSIGNTTNGNFSRNAPSLLGETTMNTQKKIRDLSSVDLVPSPLSKFSISNQTNSSLGNPNVNCYYGPDYFFHVDTEICNSAITFVSQLPDQNRGRYITQEQCPETYRDLAQPCDLVLGGTWPGSRFRYTYATWVAAAREILASCPTNLGGRKYVSQGFYYEVVGEMYPMPPLLGVTNDSSVVETR